MSSDTTSSKILTDDYCKWHANLVDLPSSQTDKIRSRLYKAYMEETGLDPWIKSETFESSQINEVSTTKKDANNYISQDCIIKISKFPEEKDVIIEAVQKRFPFLKYIKSNAWHRDVFKYTDSEAKCPVCKEVHTRRGIWGDWSLSVPNKTRLYQPEAGLRQYVIEHKMDPEKFSVITEAEKNRWTMGCFRGDLERDIRFYRGGIESKEDPRKYREFLTDRERLVGEELLRRSMVKSGLSTAWLDDLMKEWEKTYNRFVQVFSQA
ncbi:3129_t:CDS:2 [Racocetra fulgida]|uniref:3129_t:CDS:1 n=2 Tax=Glomeromycetes TaxID=214506 RepID=A0A9N9J6Y1_9GLOM|nr:3129_t:CDS:2 [Racocetra fulgida]